MVLLQLKDHLELFVKRREFFPGSRFLSRRDMTLAVKSDVKPNSFLRSFRIFWTNYEHFSNVHVLTFLECYYLISYECSILIGMSCTKNEHSCKLKI